MKRSLPLPCLMLVTEPNGELPKTVWQACLGGVNAVQWRDKGTAGQSLMDQAEGMRLSVLSSAILIVNHDQDLRVAADAHGLHLPEQGLPISEVRKRAGPDILIGCSVHSVESARQRANEGADYLIVGTIFASQSHRDITPYGTQMLTQIAAVVDLPLIAIGGVTPENINQCIKAGASGVAVLSPIMRSASPRTVARTYRAALDAAWETRQ